MLVAKIKQSAAAQGGESLKFVVVLYRVDYINNPLTDDCIYREVEFGSKISAESWVKDKDYPLVEERSVFSRGE